MDMLVAKAKFAEWAESLSAGRMIEVTGHESSPIYRNGDVIFLEVDATPNFSDHVAVTLHDGNQYIGVMVAKTRSGIQVRLFNAVNSLQFFRNEEFAAVEKVAIIFHG